MHLLTKNACIQHSKPVDICDLAGQAVHQSKQPIKPTIREHVVNPKNLEICTYSVDPSGTLDHARRVPVQIVIEKVSAILEILSFGQHVGRDEDVNLPICARPFRLSICLRSKCLDCLDTLIGMIAA